MKKFILVFCVLMFVIVISGCSTEYERAQTVIITENVDEIVQPPVQLEEDDAKVIIEIVESPIWAYGVPKCVCEYLIDYGGWEISYHTCGTLFFGEKYASLSGIEQERIDYVLKKYSLMR